MIRAFNKPGNGPRRLVGEFLGTYLLVLAAAGADVVNTATPETGDVIGLGFATNSGVGIDGVATGNDRSHRLGGCGRQRRGAQGNGHSRAGKGGRRPAKGFVNDRHELILRYEGT
ncbi:MAG: hypothetical protein NVS3B6_18350 [Pseudarthrobacter sp.]